MKDVTHRLANPLAPDKKKRKRKLVQKNDKKN